MAETIGTLLRQAREARGLTHEEVWTRMCPDIPGSLTITEMGIRWIQNVENDLAFVQAGALPTWATALGLTAVPHAWYVALRAVPPEVLRAINDPAWWSIVTALTPAQVVAELPSALRDAVLQHAVKHGATDPQDWVVLDLEAGTAQVGDACYRLQRLHESCAPGAPATPNIRIVLLADRGMIGEVWHDGRFQVLATTDEALTRTRARHLRAIAQAFKRAPEDPRVLHDFTATMRSMTSADRKDPTP